jgi:hypothetical protein
MGGNVAVIVKEPDGTVWDMVRWTNNIPYFFSKVSLFNGNFDEWFDEYGKAWKIMKDDYERNGHTGNFEDKNTQYNFPGKGVYPFDYGMIVVDAQKKKLYSSQNYASVGQINFHHLKDREALDNLSQMVEAGYIKNMTYYVSAEKPGPERLKKIQQPIDNPHALLEDLSFLARKNVFYWALDESEKIPRKATKTFSEPLSSFLEEREPYEMSLPIESDWEINNISPWIGGEKGCVMILQELLKDGWVLPAQSYECWHDYLYHNLSLSPDENGNINKESEDYQYAIRDIKFFNEVVDEPYRLTDEEIERRIKES